MLFISECFQRGIPAVSAAEGLKYDVITDCDGVLKRVQVKACLAKPAKRKEGNPRFQITVRSTSGRHQAYSEDDVDLMAIYIKFLGEWLIFPPSETKGRNMYILADSFGVWEPHRARWDLLG